MLCFLTVSSHVTVLLSRDSSRNQNLETCVLLSNKLCAQTPMSTLTDDSERQPLLPPQRQGADNSQTAENVTATVPSDDLPTSADAAEPDIEGKPYLWTVLWYIIWIAAGILVLVFFIKGFIDAGDVDVSLP